MKNVAKCKKEFFAYFNALETYSEMRLMQVCTMLNQFSTESM